MRASHDHAFGSVFSGIAGSDWFGNLLAKAGFARGETFSVAPPPEPASDIVSIAAVSNDPAYGNGSLWGMYGDQTTPKNQFGSQAGEAWAAGFTGDTNIVVGVIDSGIDYTHPDLYLNIWLNQGEIPQNFYNQLLDTDGDEVITFRDLNHGSNANYVSDLNGNGRIDAGDLLQDSRWENGVDDDGNGYRDDLIGWDWVNNDNDPYDDNSHGTHVAGTIAGMGGNDIGVAGVAWDAQLVALKFLSASGSGSIANAVKALNYYTDAGLLAVEKGYAQDFVATNNSWGGGSYSSDMQAAINRSGEAGNLFIAAAGNSSRNTDSRTNYPANYSTVGSLGYETVVSVASITNTGALSSFSNYGARTVDLGAPGSSIYSTVPGGGYGTKSGTSMAAPHVTGAIAVFAAANPGVSAQDMFTALLGSTAATSSLAGKTVTGGRLDVMSLLNKVPPPPPGPVAEETATITGILDDVGAQTGTLGGGATTDDTRPRIEGTLSDALETGESVVVYRDGAKLGTATVSGTGWSFTEASPLADDTYVYTAQVEHSGGAKGTASPGFTITVSTPATETAAITGVRDDVGGSKGLITTSGATTDDTTPRVEGTLSEALDAGEILAVFRDDVKVGEASVSGTSWSFQEAADLAYGAYSYTVQVQAGTTLGAVSDAFAITIAEPPPGPTMITGTTGSDTLVGTSGEDVISGIPATGTSLGRGTVDSLTGLAGADIFVLGDARGVFYNDGSRWFSGTGDRAVILDFEDGVDKIQLAASGGNYFFSSGNVTLSGVTGKAIYWDADGNGSYGSRDELIGLVAGSSVTLESSDFIFV